MTLKNRMLACAMLATVALSGGPVRADDLVPPPDPNSDMVVDIAPAPPETCTRFGLRYWAKRVLFDKSGSCRCIKCGWHVSPPRRICWRVC